MSRMLEWEQIITAAGLPHCPRSLMPSTLTNVYRSCSDWTIIAPKEPNFPNIFCSSFNYLVKTAGVICHNQQPPIAGWLLIFSLARHSEPVIRVSSTRSMGRHTPGFGEKPLESLGWNKRISKGLMLSWSNQSRIRPPPPPRDSNRRRRKSSLSHTCNTMKQF